MGNCTTRNRKILHSLNHCTLIRNCPSLFPVNLEERTEQPGDGPALRRRGRGVAVCAEIHHHLSRKVRSPSFYFLAGESVQISLTHSLLPVSSSTARVVNSTPPTKSRRKKKEIKSNRTRMKELGAARCVMAVALRHTLHFPSIHSLWLPPASNLVGVYDRLLEHCHTSPEGSDCTDLGSRIFFCYCCEVLCLNRRR